MGDRASISFIDKNGWESVAFFDHWGGEGLFHDAKLYVKELKEFLKTRPFNGDPLGRLEPQTVMVDFIRWYVGKHLPDFKDGRITSSMYLGVDKTDGDNSDNGHRTIKLG